MNAVPEGTETVSGEGRDIVSAISDAAKNLGVEENCVGHKLDLAHFRNASTGSSLAQRTVKIIAWVTEPKEVEEPVQAKPVQEKPVQEKPVRKKVKAKKSEEVVEATDSESEESSDSEETPAVQLEETPGADFAREWLIALLPMMDLAGEVQAFGIEGYVRLTVSVDKAGRLIGKRGSTLRSIRQLLIAAIERQFGSVILDVDVSDEGDEQKDPRRPREIRVERRSSDRDDRRGGRKSDRRGRSDDRKSDRRGRSDDRRGRSDDRRGRGDDRRGDDRRGDDRRGDDRRGDRNSKSRFPEEKLRALARRAAEKANETGKAITINLELNSYDRRVVHMEISEISGVESQSEERDGVKVVQVSPV